MRIECGGSANSLKFFDSNGNEMDIPATKVNIHEINAGEDVRATITVLLDGIDMRGLGDVDYEIETVYLDGNKYVLEEGIGQSEEIVDDLTVRKTYNSGK